MSEYKQYLDEAIKIAKLAGKTIKESFENRQFISDHLDIKQNNSSDLVTATDQYVEKMVKSHLNKVFPTHKFIGEETTAANNNASCNLTDNPTWCIDPIDGTTNFVHGLPFICISIALLINKEPVIGVIFNPILNDLYTASKNGGAFLNEKPLPTIRPIQPLETLESSLVITEYGADRSEVSVKAKLDTIHNIIKYPVHGIRSFGSAAMNMCYIARGSCDIYYEIGIHAWDVAAATCIVRESGGVVVGWEPYQNASEPEKKKLKTDEETEGTEIVNEKFDLLNRHVLCIRQLAEGPKKQNEILAEVRKRLLNFEVKRD